MDDPGRPHPPSNELLEDPVEDTAALVGTPYRPLRVLGRGGMGVVFEAEHLTLGKRVVVKLLHPELTARPDLVDRVRLEAQALARLPHPHLVDVYDFGLTPEGRPYMVMERLEGRTLREELARRGCIPWPEAVGFVRDALAGLAAAHGVGVVHRDVKLDNLFVCDTGPSGRRVVKVLDFGIAKVLRPGARGAPAPLAYPTEEGALLGTPRFLSPEQAAGKRVDARTDVYAAGVVLYTLVAGRGPFQHLTRVIDLVRAHAEERPQSPSAFLPQRLPVQLEVAILKALEKHPDDRFPSAVAFSDALARVTPDVPTEPLPPPIVARTEPLPEPTWRPRPAPAGPAPVLEPTRVVAEPSRAARWLLFLAVVLGCTLLFSVLVEAIVWRD
jgi:serine/threonine-protein kinase